MIAIECECGRKIDIDTDALIYNYAGCPHCNRDIYTIDYVSELIVALLVRIEVLEGKH